MNEPGHTIGCDEKGARWAWSLGFWDRDNGELANPFKPGTKHYHYWMAGFYRQRFVWNRP